MSDGYDAYGKVYQGRDSLRCPECGKSAWLVRHNGKILCTGTPMKGCKGTLPCRRKEDLQLPELEDW